MISGRLCGRGVPEGHQQAHVPLPFFHQLPFLHSAHTLDWARETGWARRTYRADLMGAGTWRLQQAHRCKVWCEHLQGATCTPGAEGGPPTGVWEAGEDREHAGAVPSSRSLCLAEWYYLNVTIRWSPHMTALLTEMSPTVLASLQTDAASKQLRVATATVTFPLTM